MVTWFIHVYALKYQYIMYMVFIYTIFYLLTYLDTILLKFVYHILSWCSYI